MSFVVYFIVLVITAGSVLFGLDWLHAPMSPMPLSQYELHAARQLAAPEQAAAAKQAAAPKPSQAAAETKPAPASASQPEPAKTADVPAPAPIVTPGPVAAAPPPPKCDIDACTAAYRSFNAADCTYQPFDGPRRLCEEGDAAGRDGARHATRNGAVRCARASDLQCRRLARRHTFHSRRRIVRISRSRVRAAYARNSERRFLRRTGFQSVQVQACRSANGFAEAGRPKACS